MSSTRNEGVILHKEVGKVIPDSVYAQVLASFKPEHMGYALVEDGVMLAQDSPKLLPISEFTEFQKQFQNAAMLIYLGKGPDHMPYTLVHTDGGTDPSVIAMAEGDFSGLVKPKQNKTAEMFLMENILDPIVDEYATWEKGDPSVEGFMKFLDQTTVQTDIMGAITSRGVITFMGSNGQVHPFANNEIGGKYVWGTASQKVGITDTTAVKKRKTFGRQADDTLPVEPASKPDITKVPETPILPTLPEAIPQTVPDKVEDQPVMRDADPGHCWVRVRKGLNKQDSKTFYNKAMGGVKNWRERPCVMLKIGYVPANAVNPNDTPYDYKQQAPAENKAIATALEEAKKKGDVKIVDEETAIAGNVPVVPYKQLEAFKNTFLGSPEIKKVMSGVQTIPSLEELKAIEKKFPTFHNKTSITFSQAMLWPRHKRMELSFSYPHLAGMMIDGLLNELCRMYQAKNKASGVEGGDAPATLEQPAPKKVKKWG